LEEHVSSIFRIVVGDDISSDMLVDFQIHGVISQKIEVFLTTVVKNLRSYDTV
jgi:hypothetical protein